jgi:hypothetical protein
VHEADATKTAVARTATAQVRQEQLLRLADDDVLDASATVERDADLAPGLVRELAQAGGQRRGDDAVCGDLAVVEPFEAMLLAGLEAGGVAVEFQLSFLPNVRRT